MTQGKRIILNVVATYGRSLFALVCGLFSSRWLLMVLGQSDFGLYGVVAGLTFFMSFFSDTFSSAVGRFYAYAIGRASVATNRTLGLEECRAWFNVALLVHLLTPSIALVVGYPIGNWAIRNWLSIPADRVTCALFIFKFVCIQCFACMVTVPFYAMYTAKQYIAELTLYSFAQTLFKFLLLYYMVCHPRDWFEIYAVWMCVAAVVPNVLVSVRACFVFPEIRLRFRYMLKIDYLRSICSFAGWNFFASLGRLVYWQGSPLVVNRGLGVEMNATVAISNQVSGHTTTLAGALLGAFSPAIIAAYGAQQRDKMLSFVYRACKFGAFSILLFAIPLALECHGVMQLWLKNVPEKVELLCVMALFYNIAENASMGLWVSIRATGNISRAQIGHFVVNVLGLIFLVLGVLIWRSVYVLAIVSAVSGFMIMLVRLYFARAVSQVSVRMWLARVAVPVLSVGLLATVAGMAVVVSFPPSLPRICLTAIVSCSVIGFVGWMMGLDGDERRYVRQRVSRFSMLKK